MNKRKFYIALILAALTALPAAANIVTFRLNYCAPTMKSDFWDIEFANMNYKKSNFQDTSFGFDYEVFLGRELSVVFSLDSFSKSRAGNYVDYVGITLDQGDFAFPPNFQGDFAPGHTLRYTVTPIQVSLKFAPLGRRNNFIPYIGGGVGAYVYSLRMTGDLVDHSQPYSYEAAGADPVAVYPIVSVDTWEGQGGLGSIAFGYHVFGGFMYPIGNRLTLSAEFKYSVAKANMESFTGFKPLDIGAMQFSLGINYWF